MNNQNVFELNVFSQHNLFTTLKKIVAEPRSAYSIDSETIGSVLKTESCPTLTAFWHNLLNYIIFDVSFEGEYPLVPKPTQAFDTNSVIPNICMRYKKEEIDISIHASTKDCLTLQMFYQGVRITDLHNIDSTICLEIARIIRELSDLIISLVPLTTSDSNIPLCSVLPCV
jgi:hypothetical protein